MDETTCPAVGCIWGGWFSLLFASLITASLLCFSIRHIYPAYNLDFSLDGRYIQSHYQDIKDAAVKTCERFVPDVMYHSSRTGKLLGFCKLLILHTTCSSTNHSSSRNPVFSVSSFVFSLFSFFHLRHETDTYRSTFSGFANVRELQSCWC